MIVWTFLVCGSVINQENVISSRSLPGTIPWVVMVGSAVIALVGPVVGLLASIRFGRYRALHAGLWLMWVGKVITVPLLILEWFYPKSEQILSFSGYLVAAAGFFMGFTLYIVNAVPFGLDQMPDASGEQITAFVYWNT